MDDYSVTDDNETKQYDTGKFAMMFNVTDDSGNADMVYKKRKFVVSNDIGIGTAVCANSDKKDKALLLLKALRTDDDLANILLWGEDDKSKLTDADGFVGDTQRVEIKNDQERRRWNWPTSRRNGKRMRWMLISVHHVTL